MEAHEALALAIKLVTGKVSAGRRAISCQGELFVCFTHQYGFYWRSEWHTSVSDTGRQLL
jgi:hypothetical protein